VQEEARNNYALSLMGQFVQSMELTLIYVSEKLVQIKNPSELTTDDTQRIKLLEENSVNLKNQIETMKPIFQKFKKEYAQRKKYLNNNR
jgi:hypothetical protein